jgi:hypothetical protein
LHICPTRSRNRFLWKGLKSVLLEEGRYMWVQYLLKQPVRIAKNRKGFAIMLVLMMLFLLFMLGVAFFFSAWTHAFMARNYLNMKRAFVVAEGGVQTAIGAIIGDFAWAMYAQNKPVDYNWRYWGNDPHEDRTSEDCAREARGVPVEYALNPSYALLDEDGKPRKLLILGKEVGLSGVMEGGAYGINSDIYHLKVMECSAQLYVNEGLGHPYNTAVMQRILNTLGQVLDPKIDSLGDIVIGNRPQDGYKSKAELKAILDRIDREIYPRVKDLLCVHTYVDSKVCNPVPLSLEARNAKDGYHPELFDTRPINRDTLKPITRYGRGRELMWYEGGGLSSVVDANLVYGYDELNPCYIDITSRAPVNINTAPKEILVALLQDLQGFFVMPQLRTAGIFIDLGWEGSYNFSYLPPLGCSCGEAGCEPGGVGCPVGTGIWRYCTRCEISFPGELGVIFRTTPVDQDLAVRLADRIITERTRSPFRTWAQFNRFVDRLVGSVIMDRRDPSELNFLRLPPDTGTLGSYRLLGWGRYSYYASQAIADAIKANFNPNLHLNELNPNAVLWQHVDKTDLIKNSTEFCFLPTGYFEIECVGRILRAEWQPGRFHISPYLLIMKDSFAHNNQIMGQRRLKVEVKLWDLYRQTTQRDFYQGSFSPNRAPYATGGNWACQTAPELQNGPAPYENRYEGYAMLSTIGGSMSRGDKQLKGKLYRTERQDWDKGTSSMHAHYDFDFSLHYDIANKTEPLIQAYGVADPGEPGNGPYTPVYAPDRYRVCRGYTYRGRSEFRPLIAPSDHRVDGFYGERWSLLPYYSGGGNFPPFRDTYRKEYWFRGTFSYWMKPNFLPELNSYRRIFSSIRGQGGYRLQHAYSWSCEIDEPGVFLWAPHAPYSMSNTFVQAGEGDYGAFQIETSPTLNHISHPQDWPWGCTFTDPPPPQYTPFRNHHWVLTTLSWSMHWKKLWPPVRIGPPENPMTIEAEVDVEVALYINGRRLPNSQQLTMGGWEQWWKWWYRVPAFGGYPFCVGGERDRNSTSNATFDEFYVWKETLIPTLVPSPEYSPCMRDWTGTKPSNCPDYCTPGCKYQCECPTPACPGCQKLGCKKKPSECPLAPKLCKCGYAKCNRCNLYGCDPGFYSYMCPNKDASYKCTCPPKTCKNCQTVGCVRWESTDCPLGSGSCACSVITSACGAFGALAEGCGTEDPRCMKRDCMLECDCGPRPPDMWVPTPEFEAEVKKHWWQGRYYRENDAEFTSKDIDLARIPKSDLAEPNRVLDPYGKPRWGTDEQPVRKISEDIWGKATSSSVNILGMTWTGYSDIYDYKPTYEYLEPTHLYSQLEICLYKIGADGGEVLVAGPFGDLDAGWAPIMVKIPSGRIRYRVRFNTRCNPEDAILLESPILDDVTIYYATRPQWVSWVESY